MSESLKANDYLTAEERAYIDGGGEVPPPGSQDAPESKPKPKAEPEAEEPEAAPDEPEPAEAEAEADGDDTDAEPEAAGDKKPRKVNWGAYQRVKGEAAERAKQIEDIRQRSEAREREFAAYQARVDERFKMLTQANAPRPEEPKAALPEPDPEQDPIAHLRWQREQLAEQQNRLGQFEQAQQRTVEQQRQAQQIRQLDDMYRNDNLAAVKEQPEYPNAYNYLLSMAEQEIQIQNGGRLTPAQVKAQVDQQERQLAASAFQQNMRPAQMIWQMAVARGFRPTAQQQAAQDPAQPQHDPAAEQARIDAAARGQQQNKTLSSAGRSGVQSGGMTADKFVNLSDTEAAEWLSKNPDGMARMSGAL